MPDPARAKIEPGTRLAAVLGPTAVGKTAVSLLISRGLNAEIVSVDAMQVYAGMDVGTGKPSASEREAVNFHMLDVADPALDYSVARFKREADRSLLDITARGRLPLLVGGSGLYYRALVDDLDFASAKGVVRRDVEIEEGLSGLSDLELHDLLEDLDPVSARSIPTANRKRVARAIEVARGGGRLISERQSSWCDYNSPYKLIATALDMPRRALYGLIDERVDRMISSGLEDEVRRLSAAGLRRGTTAGEALGYRQLLEYLDGEKTLRDAIEEIKLRTRRFAKRQLTWFRSDPRIMWFKVDYDGPQNGGCLEDALGDTAVSMLEYIRANLEN